MTSLQSFSVLNRTYASPVGRPANSPLVYRCMAELLCCVLSTGHIGDVY
jgi:hypothetical protein